MRDKDTMDRPPRDKSEDKRKSSNYSGGSSKRFKNDEVNYDCIFTIPLEKIFTDLKNQNIFRKPRPINLTKHMKDIS